MQFTMSSFFAPAWCAAAARRRSPLDFPSASQPLLQSAPHTLHLPSPVFSASMQSRGALHLPLPSQDLHLSPLEETSLDFHAERNPPPAAFSLSEARFMLAWS